MIVYITMYCEILQVFKIKSKYLRQKESDLKCANGKNLVPLVYHSYDRDYRPCRLLWNNRDIP